MFYFQKDLPNVVLAEGAHHISRTVSQRHASGYRIDHLLREGRRATARELLRFDSLQRLGAIA